MVPKTKLNKLKKELKGISKEAIAKKCGKSTRAVYDVLEGKHYDENVIKACVEYRDELKKKSVELAEKI